MNTPFALPPPNLFSNDWSQWAAYIDTCYGIFKTDLVDPPKPQFRGAPVIVSGFKGLDDEDKEAKFWHLVTREQPDGVRDPDPDRAERLCWIRPMIENPQHFKTWKYLEVGRVVEYRWYIWAENDNFVVILAEREGLYHLITSFWVNNWNVGKLNKKYAKREP